MPTTMIVAVPCPFCHDVAELEVPTEGFMAWQSGELIQNALPELSADDREQLISGTCPKCWDELFPESEEE